jgi:hypothetical protein
VLLEPPDQGRAVLERRDSSTVTRYQVAWRTEHALRPGAWYVCELGDSRRHSTSTLDGMTHRHFSGLRLVEQHTGRPEYWHPALHLLLPLKGYFWGRACNDWRMHDDVTVEDQTATVRLTSLDGGPWVGRLVVDLSRRLLIAYERPDDALVLLGTRTHLPPDVRYDEVPRRVDDDSWLGPAPVGSRPGAVRFAH